MYKHLFFVTWLGLSIGFVYARYNPIELPFERYQCPICYTNCLSNRTFSLPVCGHTFCDICIHELLWSGNYPDGIFKCPYCRHPYLVDLRPEFYPVTSSTSTSVDRYVDADVSTSVEEENENIIISL